MRKVLRIGRSFLWTRLLRYLRCAAFSEFSFLHFNAISDNKTFELSLAQISCSKLGSGVLTTCTWSVHSSVNTTFNFRANQ